MSADTAHYLQRLAEVLGQELLRQHLVMATAESCTAGGIAYAVTLVPGSSQWFDRGFVTYSNEAKTQMLGVAPAYLRDFGAVSEPVARAMALGALSQSAAQVAVAVTGIAGPGGETETKRVGTVCLAWALRREPTRAAWARTETRHFAGDRAAVRTQSIVVALDTLIGLLQSRHDEQAT
ncbi:MAG TPA: CinA family protein [Burkholderiaceae bacterium]|nr:CinA family protein [Burkholderiaceae bacterium]